MNARKIPAEIFEAMKGISVTLNGLTDDPNLLGEPWRSQLLEIKGSINASLADLGPVDQVPAAQEARYGLDCLKNQLLSVQQLMNWLPKVVQTYQQKSEMVMNALPAEAKKEVEKLLNSGSYVKKEDVEGLVSTARKDADLAGFNRGKLIGDRRQSMVLAGLSAEVASGAPETILLAEAKDFDPALAAAKERVTKLTGVGLALNSATMKTLPWAPQADFDAQFQTFADIFKSASKPGTVLNSNGGTPPNPFQSGPVTSKAPGTRLPVC